MSGFTSDDEGKIFFIRLRGKADGEWGWSIEQAMGKDVPNEPVGTHTTLRDVRIQSVEWKVGDYEGKAIHNFCMKVSPNGKNELYFVQMNMTQMSRGIINKLLSVRDFSNMTLRVFKGKFKPEGADNTIEYVNCAVIDAGEKVPNKYDPKEKFDPLMSKYTENGIERRDFTKVDLLIKELVETHLIPAVHASYEAHKPEDYEQNNASGQNPPNTATPPPHTEEDAPPETEEDDDLPF